MTQYDKIAKDYSSSNRTEHPQRKYVIYPSWLRVCLKDSFIFPRILDLGCGSGYSSRLLNTRKVGCVCGVDYSREQIRIAKKREQEICREAEDTFRSIIRYYKKNAKRLPFSWRGKFEIVAAAYLFHYAKSERELCKLFKESFKVLKSGGKLVAINQNTTKPVTKFVSGVSSSKEKWIDEPFQNGSRIKITIVGKNDVEVCEFKTRHWDKEMYEKCMQSAGFVDIRWSNFEITNEGKRLFPKCWEKLETCHPLVILSARKPLLIK